MCERVAPRSHPFVVEGVYMNPSAASIIGERDPPPGLTDSSFAQVSLLLVRGRSWHATYSRFA